MTQCAFKNYFAIVIFVMTTLICPGLISAQSQTTPDKIENAFNSFYQQGSKAELLAVLSNKFMIGVYGRESEDFLLKLMSQYLPCDSMTIGKRLSEGIEAKFYLKGKSAINSKIGTDENGRVLYVNYFDKLYSVDREAPSKLLFKVPFENQSGSIILTATLNDHSMPLKLLFDTGSDGMAISKTLADSLGIKGDYQKNASVVGGKVNISVSQNNTVHFGANSVAGQSIAIFENRDSKTDGIIGNTLLKKYVVKIDYDKNELSFYSLGRFDFPKEGFTIPLDLDGNLILKGNLNISGKDTVEGNFFFDTGAKYYMIGFRPFVVKNRLLVSGFKPLYVSSTISMGHSTPTFSGLAQSFSLSSASTFHQMPVTLMSGSGESGGWNPSVDGSLGVRLLSRYNITIDLLEREIHFDPNASATYPFDFVLRGYLLGFDNKGNLRILHSVLPGTEAISEEEIVQSIGGIPSHELLKNEKSLSLILFTKDPVDLIISAGKEMKKIELNKETGQ